MDLVFRITKNGEIEAVCAQCGASAGTTAPVTTNRGNEGNRRYEMPTGGIFEADRIDHPAGTCVARQRAARAVAGIEPGLPGTESHTVWPLN